MNKIDGLIIAHRGESFDAPENTIASIQLAWQRKVLAVEIDIHLTKDHEIVVIHDYDTKSISGKKLKVKDSTLRELKTLDIGSHKSPKWKNEHIPTLREVLKTIPEHCKLIIEIKSDRTILHKLKQELDQANLIHSQIEIIAFNVNTLAEAKQIMPEYQMLWLLNLDYYWPWWLACIKNRKIIKKVKKFKLDGIDVWAGKLLTPGFISEFKAAGLKIYSWTIDNPPKAKSLIEARIDGITTNRASWITEKIQAT